MHNAMYFSLRKLASMRPQCELINKEPISFITIRKVTLMLTTGKPMRKPLRMRRQLAVVRRGGYGGAWLAGRWRRVRAPFTYWTLRWSAIWRRLDGPVSSLVRIMAARMENKPVRMAMRMAMPMAMPAMTMQ
jgi:hypothetical protein